MSKNKSPVERWSVVTRQHVQRCLEFLELQHSYREIERMTGLSKATIGKIANQEIRPGDRPCESEVYGMLVDPERCKDCGALVYPPCRECQVQDEIEQRKLKKSQRC